jgi:hypothetical protein
MGTMLHWLVGLSAFLFVDVAVPLTNAAPGAVDGPFDLTASLVKGELRAGGRGTLRVTIHNRSQTEQKLGTFKSGGWFFYSERGVSASTYRNTPVGWRCGGPARVLKPNQTTSSEFEVELPSNSAGSGFLAFNFVYWYVDREKCIEQPFYWLRSITVDRSP